MLSALIVLWILLFVFLLLKLPFKIILEGTLSLRSSRLKVHTKLFGLIPIQFRFRFHLLEEPYFTLQWLRKNGDIRSIPLISKPKKRKQKFNLLPLFRKADFKFKFILGIEGDAALSVWCLGALYETVDLLFKIKGLDCQIALEPVFDKTIFRLKFVGISRLNLANIINIFIRKEEKKCNRSRK